MFPVIASAAGQTHTAYCIPTGRPKKREFRAEVKGTGSTSAKGSLPKKYNITTHNKNNPTLNTICPKNNKKIELMRVNKITYLIGIFITLFLNCFKSTDNEIRSLDINVFFRK